MRVAIVTGASKGLGRALAGGLVAAGWSVVIGARDAERLEAARVELAARSAPDAEVVAVAGDVADPATRLALVAAAERLGGPDAVVNNASSLGVAPLPPLAEYPLDALTGVLAVNLVAPLALAQLALPRLRTRRGVIMNVTSDAAVEAYEGWGGYGSSKAALEALSRVLACEEPSVRVYAVDPGDLRTDLHQAAFPGEDISDRPPPEVAVPGLLEILAGSLPSGRYRAQHLHETAGVPA